MAMLPFWPERSSRAHSLIALAALWSWAAVAMGITGIATNQWADVAYYLPQDGVSYSSGLWRECTWATFPGHVRCSHVSTRHAWAWERTAQGCAILFVVVQFFAALMFTTSLRDPTARDTRASATAASSITLLAACLGLIATAVFVSKTPGSSQPPHLTEFTWSFALFSAAWPLAFTLVPIGMAAGAHA